MSLCCPYDGLVTCPGCTLPLARRLLEVFEMFGRNRGQCLGFSCWSSITPLSLHPFQQRSVNGSRERGQQAESDRRDMAVK
ncbi:hypothetical protein ATANTOWER_011348 [Ataeniobius toweri]|uniref:Uncharacterized protein n=1 Tax=Ataeniobius toweri TaxID=208326 RepID=A0ABU7CAK5_9TELE|nr:hypothetical protein [Ataeniobius toweri]